jgi:hypothetical protein
VEPYLGFLEVEMNRYELDNPACCGGEGFSIQCVDLYKTAQARVPVPFGVHAFSLPSCNFLCGLLVGIGASAFFLPCLVRLGSCFVFFRPHIVCGVRCFTRFTLYLGGHLCFVGAALHARALCCGLLHHLPFDTFLYGLVLLLQIGFLHLPRLLCF